MELFQTEQLERVEAKLDRILAILEKPKRKNQLKEVVYSADFDSAWAQYPKRSGSNPKIKAYAAWNARLSFYQNDSKPEYAKAMYSGTVSYRAYCDATGATGTAFVMQASRFFGPNREWENDWSIPEAKLFVPKVNDDLVPWAEENGFPKPEQMETYDIYRARLWRLVKEKQA